MTRKELLLCAFLIMGAFNPVAVNLRNARLTRREDANTYLADQWLSYIRITADKENTTGISSQLSELHKRPDEFGTASESGELARS